MAKYFVIATVFVFVVIGTVPSRADCTPGSLTGHFQGIAVSKEAGSLDVSLDLRCVHKHYQGGLVTPVGTYIVKSGTYRHGELHLQLSGGTDSVSLQVRIEREALHGQFTSGDDSGPVHLRRTGEPRATVSLEASLHLSPKQWEEDIDFFALELPRRHANAFQKVTRGQFETAVAELKSRVPQMNGDEIYVALDRIANSIGDAHTYVEFPPDIAQLPLRLSRFGSDYRVVSVGIGLERALGARIVSIGGIAVTKARQIAMSMTPTTETTALADARVVGFLSMGITLHGFGIIADRNVAPYTVKADDGEQFTLTVRAHPPDSQVKWANLVKTAPLSDQNPDQDFWYVYLPRSESVYCNFRGYRQLKQNATALFREMHVKHPEKLVIDLRENSGGDYRQGLEYLIDPIRSLSKINQRGRLFVLIGTNTFSAAMSNAAQFRQRTAAMLVGQPIGERPNSYQEPRGMRLPNSKLLVRYSTQFYKFAEGDENLIRPDREIPTTWEEYKAGKNPVLEWALKYQER